MANFFCKIGTADGRIVERSFDASSREALRQNLEEQGFFVFHVRRQFFGQTIGSGHRHGRMTGARFLSFNQELLVLIRSGLPILQVIETLIEQMEACSLRDVLGEVREDIKAGSVLSESFSKYPQIFNHLYIASIRAGEKTGDLPVTISRFIDYQKRVEVIRNKIRSAAFYPIMLTTLASFVLFFMLLYVVPNFTKIFADANIELPLLTRLLIAFADGLSSFLPLLILCVIIGVFLFRRFMRSMGGRYFIDRLLLRLPFFGSLARDYAISSFTRTLGTTLASGTPLVPSMTMSRGTLNNRCLEKELAVAVQRVEEGTSLSESLTRTEFFPPIALRMVAVGETTGSLNEMLRDVADYYESEVEKRLIKLTTMIEPILMMVMGVMIGLIVLAMYIPIFQMGQTVR
ncbi:type II secretion system F family protein [Geopsychrobacter electrodiphilus]|uniref:type II secretion system F family protein n=1 Tax=Geopsychrobacter electrodiphilus TaxID=225196 RepID=UPI000369C2EF|nr:type II secretion system F family protein [Geopsychrobacter electrodiphilus]